MPTFNEVLMAQLELLNENDYPGRLVIAGRALDTNIFTGTVMDSRSPDNRNRKYLYLEGGRIETAVADPDKSSGEAKLTIYSALDDAPHNALERMVLVVSNGRQTERVKNSRAEREPLYVALHAPASRNVEECQYEPDSIGTPRITATVKVTRDGSTNFSFSALRKDENGGGQTIAHYYNQGDLPTGVGYLLWTYERNGPTNQDPPVVYFGPPIRVPLVGNTVAEIVDRFVDIFGKSDHFIGIAGKLNDGKTGKLLDVAIRNRYAEDFDLPKADKT